MWFVVFFFKQKTAYEVLRSLVGSEMCIRDSLRKEHKLAIVKKDGVYRYDVKQAK